jgi:hypothetical protein
MEYLYNYGPQLGTTLLSLWQVHQANVGNASAQLSVDMQQFASNITERAGALSIQAETIVHQHEILERFEKRITAILSDYTSLLNQVSIVSTLILGIATATFGSLLGNTDDQPQWKVNMYVISCILTVCFSVFSVIESFFLSINIYTEESRFISGNTGSDNYGNQDNDSREFNMESLKGLSATYSRIVLSFFFSFLTFPLTLLSMTYIGLGLSENILISDDSPLMDRSDIFIAPKNTTLGVLEYSFQSVAFLITMIIIVLYIAFILRFSTKYFRYILWPRSCRDSCCTACKDSSLKQPMVYTTKEFKRASENVMTQYREWQHLQRQFKKDFENLDEDYKIFLYQSLLRQIKSQHIKLMELTFLQVTNREKRTTFRIRSSSYDENKDDGGIELVSIRGLTMADTNIKF